MKKAFGGALKFCFIVLVCAIGPLSYFGTQYYDAKEEFEADRRITYVGFSETEDVSLVDYETVRDYAPRFAHLRSNVYFSALNDSEKAIYRLLEYAMENGKTHLFFDEALMAGTRRPIGDIIKFYSLDSPMLEQNVSYSYSDASYTFSYFYEHITFERQGLSLEVKNFSADRLQKKEEALAEAQRLAENMPKHGTQREDALYLYKSFLENKSYGEYPKGEVCHYLYDGIVGNATQCDGFANAYALLARLKGIEVLEKKDDPPEGEEGHTWNGILLDGAWYNVDCSLSEEARRSEIENDLPLHFAFSDALLEVSKVAYGDLLPSFTENIIPVRESFENYHTPDQANRLTELIRSAGEEWVLVRIESGEMPEDWLGPVANRLRSTVRYLAIPASDGTYIYLKKE